MRLGRAAAFGALLLLHSPQASADWLITPFIGMKFSGETTFLVLERGAGERGVTFGGSVALLSNGLLGIEADVAHTSRFFEEDHPPIPLIRSSRVTTIGGNVLVAAPVSFTRESLRPYLVGGLGLIQARVQDLANLLPLKRDLLGLTLGVGANGMLSERTGVRFDLRRLKAITGEGGEFAADGVSRLSFWRASLGVIMRY